MADSGSFSDQFVPLDDLIIPPSDVVDTVSPTDTAYSPGDLFGSGTDATMPIGEPPIPTLGGAINSRLGSLSNMSILALANVLVPTIALVIAEVGVDKPVGWVKKLVSYNADDIDHMLAAPSAQSLWHWMSGFSKHAFIAPMLELGVGIDLPTKAKDPQAANAIELVDTMIAFATGMQLAIATLQTVLKPVLGGRISEAIEHTLGKIPEEMGLSWALGMTIERVFEAGFGEALLAYIRSKTRPNKPEWQIARAMLKQHVIEPKDLDEILADTGFSNEWIDRINRLETQPLPIGDIGALYRQGLIPADHIDRYVNALGFSDEIAGLLKELYITNAETATGSELRSVWRTLYHNSLVSESEYRAKLKEVHFPDRLIDQDIEAINDELKYGWKLQSISVIKSEYVHDPSTSKTAVSKLQVLGYSHTDALAMVASWGAPPIRKQHGLTQAQVMKYYVAGVLNRDSAQTHLLALGVDNDTVQFLLDHPTTASGSHVVRLTPGLITQAYIAGAVDQSQLKGLFTKAGAADTTVQYLYDTAVYKYDKAHHLGVGSKLLTEGNVLAAFKYGIYDQPTAFNALVAMGYTQQDAFVLLEIEEKGPIRPPLPPAFATVEAAFNYLLSLGLSLSPPPDPTYEAAIAMVEQAGISIEYPLNWVPPYGNLPFGGPGPVIPPQPQPPPNTLPPPPPVQPPVQLPPGR